MKTYLPALLVIITTVSILYYISNKIENNKIRIEKEKEYVDSLTIAEQQKFCEFVDSIGTLSFYDISLGSSLVNTMKEMKNNKIFSNITNEINKCFAKMNIALPKDDITIPVELNIFAFQDTIYCIKIWIEQYLGSRELKRLYYDKYNLKYATVEEKELGIDREEKYYWNFKEQSITFRTNYLLRKSTYERNLSDERALWGKFNIRDNIYFDFIEIEYLYIPINKIVKKLQEEEYQRKQEILKQEQLIKHKIDSINKSNKTKEIIRNI